MFREKLFDHFEKFIRALPGLSYYRQKNDFIVCATYTINWDDIKYRDWEYEINIGHDYITIYHNHSLIDTLSLSDPNSIKTVEDNLRALVSND